MKSFRISSCPQKSLPRDRESISQPMERQKDPKRSKRFSMAFHGLRLLILADVDIQRQLAMLKSLSSERRKPDQREERHVLDTHGHVSLSS